MKMLKWSWLGVFALVFVAIACQKDAVSPSETSAAKKGVSSECSGTYNVALTKHEEGNSDLCTGYSGTSTTFEWTITFPKGTQNVSHFSLILNECVDFTDIVAVYYKNNLTNTLTCLNVVDFTYQIDKSLGCTNEAVVKFDMGGKSGEYTYGLVLKGDYAKENSTASFIKSGAKSGCCSQIIEGPACPTYDNSCNLSQGYWFRAPHSDWCEEVQLGSYSYTKEEGEAIWETSNKFGISAAKRAFTQYSAIWLDIECQNIEVTTAVSDAMATIVAILGNIELSPANIQSLNLTATQNADLIAAAGVISAYIDYLEEENCND
jgi:hypothetical protein